MRSSSFVFFFQSHRGKSQTCKAPLGFHASTSETRSAPLWTPSDWTKGQGQDGAFGLSGCCCTVAMISSLVHFFFVSAGEILYAAGSPPSRAGRRPTRGQVSERARTFRLYLFVLLLLSPLCRFSSLASDITSEFPIDWTC